MTEQETIKKIRKSYSKPKIERVRLSLQDTVLGTGCKTEAASSPGGGSDCVTSYCVDDYGS